MNRLLKWSKWDNIPLRKKFLISFVGVLLVIVIVFFIVLNLSGRHLSTMDVILEEYHATSRFIQSFGDERITLSQLNTSRVAFDQERYEDNKEGTDRALYPLKIQQSERRNERMALKNAVITSFEVYRESEKELLGLYRESGNRDETFITKYYQLQAHSEYIKQYASMLLEESLRFGTAKHQQVLEGYQWIRLFINLAGVFGIMYIFITSRLLEKNFIRPILTLKDRAQGIIEGNFESNNQGMEGSDEIAKLVQTFDIMEKKLQHRMNLLADKAEMERQLRRKEVENERMGKFLEQIRFAQLQSQMNPHFLFNCLNTIYSLAMIEEASLTKEMISTLSDFFRYTLESGKDLVPLKEEMKIVRSYMDILHYRFSDRIQLKVQGDIPENILIPKFIIQPLVENAVVHGFASKYEGGIKIKFVTHRDRDLEIFVIDNGIGFQGERSIHGKSSIGIANIRNRLELFDPDSRVSIWSKRNIGTVVRLRLKGRFHDQDSNC